VIFLASDPARWAPLDEALHVGVGRGQAATGCEHDDAFPHRCLADACTLAARRGAAGIATPHHREEVTVEAVIGAVERVLARAAEVRA
jgi:hypothetical protein